MKKGFTLVELSIVLVIIGLLIGGILVGRSMTSTARVNKMVREFQQYEVGINLFKERYKYLPGDYPQRLGLCSGSSTCAGNGDGRIYTQVLPANNLEVRNVWYHMQAAELLNLNLPFTTTGNQVSSTWITNDNFPQSSYGKGIRIDVGSLESSLSLFLNTATAASTNKVVIMLSGPSGGFMSPINAMAIDQKLDDARPASGIFFGGQAGVDNCIVWGSIATNKYDIAVTTEDNACLLALVIDEY